MNSPAGLHHKNLELFRVFAPNLARDLEDFQPTTQLVNTDGKLDILDGGQPRYGGDADAFAVDRLDEFRRAADRLSLSRPQPGQFDKYTERFFDALTAAAEADGIDVHPEPVTPGCYFLLVLGIGFGHHLEALADATQCQILHLCDTNIEDLHHSLDVYDWERLFRALGSRGANISFSFNDTAEDLARSVYAFIRFTNPVSVDGYSILQFRDDPVFTEAVGQLKREIGALYGDLGHLYDELLMLKNAYGNLHEGGAAVYRRPRPRDLGIPVFVVASGPSLDAEFEFLRENRDNAILVSAGSALGALAANGILSDFRIETENINVLETVSFAEKYQDLDAVTLVAATTVDRSVLGHFADVLYYFRSGLCTFPLLADGPEQSLSHPDPTVLNAAFSFAHEVGLGDVYLFGVDLGTKKDGGAHHAKDTYHYEDGARQAGRNLVFDIEVPGNFGGACLCSRGFYAARANLIRAIRDGGGTTRVFNCSDGCLVDGAEPVRSVDLDLKPLGERKAIALSAVRETFPAYGGEIFEDRWRGNDLADTSDRFVQSFKEIVAAAPGFADKLYLTPLMALLKPRMGDTEALAQRHENTIRFAYRGTLYMMLIVLEYLMNRITEPERFEPIVRRELDAALGKLSGLARGIILEPLTRELPAEDLQIPWEPPESPLAQEPFQPRAEGAGAPGGEREAKSSLTVSASRPKNRVGRNAPCPCGSGKKYKHCHGKAA